MLSFLFFTKNTILLTFVVLVLLQCNLTARSDVGKLINNTRNIRDAQIQLMKKTGRYSTLEELEKSGVVKPDLESIKNLGYTADLTVQGSNYNLLVKPKTLPEGNSEDDVLSLYVDNSGIIRASVKPEKMAHAESSSIAEQ